MNVRRKRIAAMVAVVVTATATVLGSIAAGGASAAVTPGWQPDPNDAGTLGFYDAAGHQITSGSINDSPMAAYYAGSGGAIMAGNVKSFMAMTTPVQGANSATWPGTQQVTSSQDVPATGLPGSLAGSTHAVVAGAATDGSLNDVQIAAFPNSSTAAGYQDLYEVRVYTTGGPGTSSTFYAADVQISGTTWTQVFPVVSTPTATTTTLAVTPASPQVAGTSITLTATVTPGTASGTVQFMDGATALGSANVSGGTASITTSTLAAGSHSITASFQPADTTAFSGSTSSAVPYTITSPAVSTTTTLGASPSSPVVSGTSVSLTATLTPSSAVGSVQFKDGATSLGSAVAVSGGTAHLTTSTLTVGSHSITAAFTPTNPASFTASTSSALPFSVTAAGPTSTTTTLAVTPTSPAAHGTTETLTATVAPSGAAGTVAFMDGATQVGSTQPVAAGSASVTSVLADGSHSLTAVFTPTDATAFTASTSTAVAYTVNTAAATTTTTTLGVTPASPAASGTSETLTATVTPSGAAGTVAFMDGATQVGSTQTVAAGSASVTSVLADGSHSLTAVFTPTDPTAFTASTSTAAPYTVTPAGPTSTTTALAVTPASPAASGTSETLTATVTPSGAAGTVAFMDGATQVGSTQTVSGGTASVSSVLADGSHSLTAVFTPTDATAFSGSTSEAVPYSVTPAGATSTTTTLDVVPASPATSGATETLTATVTPSDAAGTVTFMDGAAQVGATQPVSGGTASVRTVLADGSHSLTAVFTPTDATAFAASTSDPVSYEVTGVGPVATTTGLSVTPTSPAASGTTETLTAAVTPMEAAGTVAFFDGSTQVGSTQTVSGGSASVSVVLGDGSHSLTAVFTPADVTAFASSTSDAASYTVTAGSSAHRTRLHLTVWPHGHSFWGQRVFMVATIAPRWAHGTVEFFSGGRLLGVAHLKNGVARFSTDDLKVGTHALWARYVPWNPDNFAKSASNAVRIQVLPIPCKGRGHDGDASPAVFFMDRGAAAPAGF